MDDLLMHGSLALILVVLLAAGLGFPMPEEIVLLTAGVLIHRGAVDPYLAVAVCAAGVLGGDLLTFVTAKRLGSAALKRRPFRSLLPPDRRARLESLIAKHGSKVVLFARFVTGLRAPTFAVAGIHGMSTVSFVAWDGLGTCITVPLYMGLGYLFSDRLADMRRGVVDAEHIVVFALVFALVAWGVVSLVRRARGSGGGPRGQEA